MALPIQAWYQQGFQSELVSAECKGQFLLRADYEVWSKSSGSKLMIHTFIVMPQKKCVLLCGKMRCWILYIVLPWPECLCGATRYRHLSHTWDFRFSRRRIWSLVYWDVTPCSLTGVEWRFRGAYCLHHQGDDDGGSTRLWNVGTLQWDYTALHLIRL
jgi:hypothetical protein